MVKNCVLCGEPEIEPGVPSCECFHDRWPELQEAQRRLEIRKQVRESFVDSVPTMYRNYLATPLPTDFVAHNPEAHAYMAGEFDARSIVYLFGVGGRGKTHLGTQAVGRLVRDLDLSGTFIDEVEYFRLLEGQMHSGPAPRDPFTPQAMLYDDFGRRKGSPWVLEKVFGIINHRMSHGLTTVITSNFSPEKAVARLSGDPDDATGILSRLRAGRVFEITGTDDHRAGSFA